jgi:hypothetical protein
VNQEHLHGVIPETVEKNAGADFFRHRHQLLRIAASGIERLMILCLEVECASGVGGVLQPNQLESDCGP